MERERERERAIEMEREEGGETLRRKTGTIKVYVDEFIYLFIYSFIYSIFIYFYFLHDMLAYIQPLCIP